MSPAANQDGTLTLRSRLISVVSQQLNGLVYTQRHGLIAGLRRRGGLGFIPGFLLGDGAQTPELRFLAGLDVGGLTVFDVGAYHGLLTLHFARTARQVVAYEPNPASRTRLLENVALNRFANVLVRDVAVGREPGEIELVIDAVLSGTATADPSIRTAVESHGRKTYHVRAAVVRLDDEVRSGVVPPPQLVKIDVEGLELAVLRGMEWLLAAHQPSLYLEMHGAGTADKEARVRAIVDFLVAHGYADILHVESGTRIDAASATAAREGHLYCRAS